MLFFGKNAENLLLQSAKFGKIDISVVFNRRIFDLIRLDGYFGLISTTNVSEGISVNVGLGSICKKGEFIPPLKA